MLVLIIGDLHVPHRVLDLPAKFRKLLVPSKLQHVLCTGNLCGREMLDYLRTLTCDVHAVRGDFEDDAVLSKLPDTKVVTMGAFRVGLLHGHQVIPWRNQEALSSLARQLDVDVLVSGHTHESSIRVNEGKLFVDPGSATGAFTPLETSEEIVPSFVLMDVQAESIVLYRYRLVDDEVKVDRHIFKNGGIASN